MRPSIVPIAADESANTNVSTKQPWRGRPFVALLALSGCMFMQGVIVNGLIIAVLTSIERRFKLKSTEVVWIVSSFHLIQCLFQPLVAYLGGKGHQPRWIGVGMMGMGLVTFMIGIPHFTTGNYQIEKLGTEVLCNESINVTSQCENESGLQYYLIYFIAMQLLNGIMNIPLITLGIAYLHQVASNAPLYQGIFLASATIGAAAGYTIGGSTLKLPTDITHSITIDVTSSLWVGAWWIGFLATGILTFLVSIPVLLLPKVQSENQPKGFGKQAKILLKLPVYFLFVLVVSLDYGTFSGMTSLLPKYLETNFYYSAGEASLYIGLLAVTGGVLGQVGGGLIVNRFGLDVEKITKLVFLFSAVIVGFSFLFLLQCPPLRIANHTNLTCSSHCKCSFDQFEPVCGQDDVTYFSPCFAGCLGNENEGYYNCSCVQNATNNGSATRGDCQPPHCTTGGIFVGLFVILLCFHMGSLVPTIQGCIKVVEGKEITFIAVGVMWVFIRLLGMFPFPLIYSEFFKSACEVWRTECGEQVTCAYYDNRKLNLSLLLLLALQKGVNLLLLGCAYILQRRQR